MRGTNPSEAVGKYCKNMDLQKEHLSILKFYSKYVNLLKIYDEVQPWQECVIFVEKDRSLATM